MEINTTALEEMINEACTQEDPTTLYAIITLLAKDLIEFLAVGAYKGNDVNFFFDTYIDTLDEDRPFWLFNGPELFKRLGEAPSLSFLPDFFNYYPGPTGEENPQTFAEIAIRDEGKIEFEDLFPNLQRPAGDEALSWTGYPGWALTKAVRIKIRDILCERGEEGQSIISNFVSGRLADNKSLALAIAEKLLETRLSDSPYWHPLAAYLGTTIMKTDIVAFCAETEPEEEA